MLLKEMEVFLLKALFSFFQEFQLLQRAISSYRDG